MITTTDAVNIIFRDCQVFDIPTFQDGNIPQGIVDSERIVIHGKEQTSEATWKKCFIEVNFFVPDVSENVANLIRLNAVERMAIRRLKGMGKYDGVPYRYNVATTYLLQEQTLKAHYINVKILFRVLNITE